MGDTHHRRDRGRAQLEHSHRLLQDEHEMELLRKGAEETIEKNFSFSSLGKSYSKIYTQIMN